MRDAFGVSKGASTPMRLVPTYMKRRAARQAGGAARRAFKRGFKTEPPAPVVREKAWYRKGSNQALMGLGAAAVGGGAFVGYRRSKQQQVVKSLVRLPGGGTDFLSLKKLREGGKTHAELKAMIKGTHKETTVPPNSSKWSKDTTRVRTGYNNAVAALRPLVQSKKSPLISLSGSEPRQMTTVRGRKVHIHSLSGDAPMAGFQMAVPTPGKGQRQAQHVIAAPDGPSGNITRTDTLRHEIQHANKRKPLSAVFRQFGRNQKGWMEEARADSAMTSPNSSGYERMARGQQEAYTNIGDDPKHMRRYLKTKKKIAAAQGNTTRKPIKLTRTDTGQTSTLTHQVRRTPIALPGRPTKFHVDSKGETVRKRRSA